MGHGIPSLDRHLLSVQEKATIAFTEWFVDGDIHSAQREGLRSLLTTNNKPKPWRDSRACLKQAMSPTSTRLGCEPSPLCPVLSQSFYVEEMVSHIPQVGLTCLDSSYPPALASWTHYWEALNGYLHVASSSETMSQSIWTLG